MKRFLEVHANMLPDVEFAFPGLPVANEVSLKPMNSHAVSTVGDEEIGCAAKITQDALDGPHVDGSQ